MFDAVIIRYEPLHDFIWAFVIAWGACLAGFWGLWLYYRRLRNLLATPRSLIRSAAQGYVGLQGTARLMQGEPIVAPLTGKRCVWWSYRIESRSRMRGSWSTLTGARSDTSTDIFMLDDGTGWCVVDPEHAEVTPSARDAWSGDEEMPEGGPDMGSFGGNYRYVELRIEEGAPLCALGYFHTQDPVSGAMIDEEVRQQLAAWKRDQVWLKQRFDANHDGQVDMQEWDAARQEARRLVLEREQENLKRPPVNIISCPADGREFLLSTRSRSGMEFRLRLYIGACLLVFFLGGAYGTFLADARLVPPAASGVP